MKKGILFLIVFLVAATFCYAEDTIGLVNSYPGKLLSTENGDAAIVFHETRVIDGVYENKVSLKVYDKSSGIVTMTSNFDDMTGYNFSFCATVANEIVFVFSQQACNAVFRSDESMLETIGSGNDSTDSVVPGIIRFQHRPSKIVSVNLSTGIRNWLAEIDGNAHTLESNPEGGWYVRCTQYEDDTIIEKLTALSSNGVVLWSKVIHEETIEWDTDTPDPIPLDVTSSEDGVLNAGGAVRPGRVK